MKKIIKKVFIVHAVDTEGPLYESSKATFERANELLNLKIKSQNKNSLEKLRKGIGYKGELKKKILKIFNSHLIEYNTNWKKIKQMLTKISSKNFRNKIIDDAGKQYVLTWHCVDHVNYKLNPRKREIGYGKIFKFYKNFIKKNNLRDKIGFHYHPMSTYKEAHRNATLWHRSENLYQILCRRIIDEKWFPVANRAGFHVERPDSHLFLEQYIPFDLSNTNKKEKKIINSEALAASGWDWRRAPTNWELYNPSHDDYQIKGNCRRVIGRVLSINNRTESIDQNEVYKAFKRAQNGKNTLLAVTSHDFRNIETEILEFYSYIKKAKLRYPKVKFSFQDTVSAFQKTLNIKNKKEKLKLKISKVEKNSFKIKAIKGKVFGPQPFLAIKFKNNRYFHDNLDFSLKKNEWFYTLGPNTVKPEDVKIIAVGAADKNGNFHTTKIKL
jgi:hypothetical protein